MSRFPGGKRFAFTVFDDTDNATVAKIGPVYRLLSELGFRTTKSVWPFRSLRPDPSSGETLADTEYRALIVMLQRDGFEIGLHNVRDGDSPREVVLEGLDRFADCLGCSPRTHCNHRNNLDNLYWGGYRLHRGINRAIYKAANLFRGVASSEGHIASSPFFWGDVCRQQIDYVRNFVFAEVNLDLVNPTAPYHDPTKPDVKNWFSSCEGSNVTSYCRALCEANQDRLEEQEGVCIMYTHFASGFCEAGTVDQRFRMLMQRLARKNGWFVPVATLLDFLRTKRSQEAIPRSELAAMERRWLVDKLRRGRS